MPLASFVHDKDRNRITIQGPIEQRQTVYHLQKTLIGPHDLYEVIRDMNAQGLTVRITIEVFRDS